MSTAPSDPAEYIASLRAQGVRDADIARALREAGWTRDQVRELLHPTPLPPAPGPPGPTLPVPLPPEPPPENFGFDVRFPSAEFTEPDLPAWGGGCSRYLPVTCGCLVVLAVVVSVVLPAVARWRFRDSPVYNSCLSNAKQLTLGMVMYASDNSDRFPPAGRWDEAIFPYVKSEQIFVCPSDLAPRRTGHTPRELSYTMNAVARGRKTTEGTPALLPVVFEGTKLYGGSEAGAFRHNGGMNVGFADCHAKWVSRGTFTPGFLEGAGGGTR